MPFIGQEPLVGGYHVLDNITTSATNTYNLTLGGVAFSPESANHLLVSLNGVIQKPGGAFSVSGSQITFIPSSGTLSNTDSIDFIVALGNVLDVGAPSDNTISSAKIIDDAVTGAKLANNIVINTTGNITSNGTVTGAEVSNGNFMIDQWRINNAVADGSNGDVVIGTAGGDWERVDNQSSYSQLIGSQMNEGSGTFTFPRTGVYLITFFANLAVVNGDTNPKVGIKVTIDGDAGTPTYNWWSRNSTGNAGSGNANILITTQALINCDNVTKVKCQFHSMDFNNGTSVQGNTTYNLSYATFERKGPAN